MGNIYCCVFFLFCGGFVVKNEFYDRIGYVNEMFELLYISDREGSGE